MKYQPERYLKDGKLDPDVMDPDSVAFGFGRRSVDITFPVIPCTSYGLNFLTSICPGKHFVDNSLYILASCLLAVYDITPPVDDRGNAIELKPEFTSSLVL